MAFGRGGPPVDKINNNKQKNAETTSSVTYNNKRRTQMKKLIGLYPAKKRIDQNRVYEKI